MLFEPMPTAPVGVYDSGVGGISVLRELRAELPAEDFVYVADTAWCPYGGRPAAEIVERAVAVTEFLLAGGAKAVVVACNTATVAAVETLRATYPIAIVAMEPAVKPAAGRTRSGVVGVLATGVALAGDRFHGLVARHARGVRVVTQPCPGLVEQIEVGDLDGPRTRELVERYVAPLREAGADTIVLGCTHYPFVAPLIAAAAGPGVELIDTGAAVARRTRDVLVVDSLVRAEEGVGSTTWYSSAADPDADVFGRLWGVPVEVATLPPATAARATAAR